MNKLFKNRDYVLLSDCAAFDEKYELPKDTTMWAVARKMEGGEPNKGYMNTFNNEICVGIHDDDAGVWKNLVYKLHATKLTVEDVLYRSEDGLTLDELSQIPGAFYEDKYYECVEDSYASVYDINQVYATDGKGIVFIAGLSGRTGTTSKFKPVTTKPKPKPWTPSVGEEVMFYAQVCIVEHTKDDLVWITRGESSDLVNVLLVKPIDKERERVIKKASRVFSSKCASDYSGQPFLDGLNALYDAGMLNKTTK